MNAILNTLSKADAVFVKVGADWKLDKNLINSNSSKSGNFDALKTLVNDTKVYEISVGSEFNYKTETGDVKTMSFGEINAGEPADQIKKSIAETKKNYNER